MSNIQESGPIFNRNFEGMWNKNVYLVAYISVFHTEMYVITAYGESA